MVFDEIVVGSGLSALGAVLGLPANRRVLVIGDQVAVSLSITATARFLVRISGMADWARIGAG
jgi:aspartate oxidase